MLTCQGTCIEVGGQLWRVSFLFLPWLLVTELRLSGHLSHLSSCHACSENVTSTSLFPVRLYSFPGRPLSVLPAPPPLILDLSSTPTHMHLFLLSFPLPSPQLPNLLLRGVSPPRAKDPIPTATELTFTPGQLW